MKIGLVLAMSENGVIGLGGNPPFDLPWHLPADLKRFKRLTVGRSVIMGRKTFESIGRPLPRRHSVVITRNPEYEYGGPLRRGATVAVVHTLEDALQEAAGRDRPTVNPEQSAEIFVIGGAEIFARALPRAERVYLTRVHAEVEGNVSFPELDLDSWQLVSQERYPADEQHAHDFSFEVWERPEEKRR